MKQTVGNTLAAGGLAVLLANAATAGALYTPSSAPGMEPEVAASALIDMTFTAPSVEQVSILDDAQMRETEGELWPFIFGVAAVDIGLAGFYWGVYVPTVAGPCRVCDIGSKSR